MLSDNEKKESITKVEYEGENYILKENVTRGEFTDAWFKGLKKEVFIGRGLTQKKVNLKDLLIKD